MSSPNQCKFQSLFQSLTVCNWVWYFLVRCDVFFVGISKFMGIFWWLHFVSQRLESVYHFLVSKLVLLVEFYEIGCCMACVSSIALTELNDGMLAVSTQCGWCHQWSPIQYVY